MCITVQECADFFGAISLSYFVQIGECPGPVGTSAIYFALAFALESLDYCSSLWIKRIYNRGRRRSSGHFKL
jgi:hypothetical protein